ncbi:hypothetical protein GCM10023063_04370 [Arthrobacter methylotrophus]
MACFPVREGLPAHPSAKTSWASNDWGAAPPEPTISVLKNGTLIGEVTSGQPSPTIGYPVALAYVDVEHAEPSAIVDVELRWKAEPFEVEARPFYKRQK